jgi:hypothetical protein
MLGQQKKWGAADVMRMDAITFCSSLLRLLVGHQIPSQAPSLGFVVDKLAFGQVFLRMLRFFSVTVATSVRHTRLSITDAL